MSDKLNATVKTWELLEAIKIVENLENEYGDNVKRYLMRCIEKN